MAALTPNFDPQFFDGGTPAAGYSLYTYATGTTTPLGTWQDQAGTVPNANPIVLDAAGRCKLWLSPGVEYRLTLKTTLGATVSGYPVDDVAGAATSVDDATLRADLASTASSKGAALIGFKKTTGTATKARTVQTKSEDRPSVLDFDGIDPSGATSSHIAFRNALQWALDNDTEIYVPPANALGYYRLDDEVGIAQPDTLLWGRSLRVVGGGAGSRIVVNHTGDGFRFYSSVAVGSNDSRVTFEMDRLCFRGGSGTFSAVTPSTFIHTEFGINPRFTRLMFMSAGTSVACIKNEYGYGATYDQLIFRGILGTGIRMRQDQPDSTGFSHVVNMLDCDFSSLTGKAIHHDAGGCWNIIGGTIQACGDGIWVDPTAAAGLRMSTLNIQGTWFEANTGWDINLASNASSWSEATIDRCQFSGNGATPGKINLGAKSRITVSGYPLGNQVEVTGNTSAGFIGIGILGTQWTNNGVPFWTSIDPLGATVLPQTLTAAGRITANDFVTSSGTTSVPTATATTLFTMPSSANGVYMITTTAGVTGPAAWTVVALISCSASIGKITVLQTSTNLTLTASGLAIQGTHATGSTVSVSWTVTRLQA